MHFTVLYNACDLLKCFPQTPPDGEVLSGQLSGDFSPFGTFLSSFSPNIVSFSMSREVCEKKYFQKVGPVL